MKRRFSLFILLSVCISFFLVGRSNNKNTDEGNNSQSTVTTEPISDRQFLMGTYVEIKIYQEGKEDALKKAYDRVETLADKITVNEPGSEIDEINEKAGVEPVKVSEDVLYLMNEAYDYSSISNSGFDMAIGPITKLWRIGFSDARKPSQEEIDNVLPLVNYKDVEIDNESQTVFLTKKGMALDLGAIAKGYITDEVVKVLQDEGVTTAIIDLGGNVYVMGKSPNTGKNWKIGIQDPNEERYTTLGSLPASNQSIVTSGIYERFLELDGVKYHHIFDPRTGYPVDNNLASVTVISDKSIDGDGLTTVLFAKGVSEGLDYIQDKKDVEAIFVTKDKKVYASDGIYDEITMDMDSGYSLQEKGSK